MDNYQENLGSMRCKSNGAGPVLLPGTNFHHLENTSVIDHICLASPKAELSFCLVSISGLPVMFTAVLMRIQ